MTIYLYHKRHLNTGLNYFGKTKGDPINYNGSGVYWNAHLKKHGYLIETVNVWEFVSQEECTKFAINFSTKHDIVKSDRWANLCVEDGIGGGDVLSQLAKERYDEICAGRSIKTKASWAKRSKTEHAETQSAIWTARGPTGKKEIYDKISKTLKSKTPEQMKVTRAKRKITESRRAPLVCPHCQLISKGVANMYRYHFDKCKKKLND
jgi:hypothetical protein